MDVRCWSLELVPESETIRRYHNHHWFLKLMRAPPVFTNASSKDVTRIRVGEEESEKDRGANESSNDEKDGSMVTEGSLLVLGSRGILWSLVGGKKMCELIWMFFCRCRSHG
ncbi:hypothetical protein Sjap_019851 [Stephania japonica]|uniref:Uncharacterized protein n=1 Tax=Stephania japonica TaxID=461633 RepID=A0AAP0HYH7_9MAGN